MSHTRLKNIIEKITTVRSLKSLAFNFFLNTRAGQKIFLYNKKLPRVINISPIEHTCMFKCSMCPFNDTDTREMYSQKAEMSFDTLKNIVKCFPNDSYYSFDISAIGETLLLKQLPDFIKHMKTQKPLINTIISTNGLLLSEDIFLKLVDSGLDNIQISLYAENAEDHEMITGSKTFDKIKDNVIKISALRKKVGLKKPYLQIFMMEAAETISKSDRFITFWSQYVDSAFVRPIYNVGREIKGLTPLNSQLQPQRYPCVMPWYSTAIRSNGDVLPCYMFHWYKESKDLVLGNINLNSMQQIWESKLFQDFRCAHLKLNLDSYSVCKNCDLWAAYTNIWEKCENSFRYDNIKITDYLKKSTDYKGG